MWICSGGRKLFKLKERKKSSKKEKKKKSSAIWDKTNGTSYGTETEVIAVWMSSFQFHPEKQNNKQWNKYNIYSFVYV